MRLHKDFTRIIVNSLPEEVRDLCILLGDELLIAGGFCRDTLTNEPPKDIDLFARSAQGMKDAVFHFDWTHKYTMKHTLNAETFKPHEEFDAVPVQFITRVYYDNHEETIKSFDFSVCQVGVYFDKLAGKWVGICTEEFLEDLPAFRCRYTAPTRDEDPGASVLRMIRLTARGFHFSEGEVAKVVGRFVAALENDPTPREFPEPEASATRRVKEAFRRIGYAGKPNSELAKERLESLAADEGDRQYDLKHENEVPF